MSNNGKNFKNDIENPKLKLIIISKKGRSEKREDGRIITLKKDDGRMELRIDNLSETITKKKIDRTFQTIIKNNKSSEFKMKNDNNLILDNKSSTLSEREKYINSQNNYDDNIFGNNNNQKYIEEKVNNDNKEKIKHSIIFINDINETSENNNENNINNNDDNKNSNNDDISIKSQIVFNDFRQEEIYKKDEINQKKGILNINNENLKIKTEQNIYNNNKNIFRELIKSEKNIDKKEEYKDEKNECKEDIYYIDNHNNLSSNKEYESNKAVKNEQTEREINKYIISSLNDGLNNFNNFFRNNINNNNNENKNIKKEKKNTFYEKEIIANELDINSNNNLVNKKTTLFTKNSIINNNLENETRKELYNSKYSRNKNYIPTQFINPSFRACTICENTCSLIKIFVAECGVHFLCKRCAKNYFEEQIENGETNLHCPFLFCKANFDKNLLKSLVSEEHYHLLEENENENKIIKAKIKSNINDENIKTYLKNNVLDINNNKILYNYHKSKDIFCSKCNKDALFSKASSYFLKCLNCGYRECKYCFKEYTLGHMDRNKRDHCKVFLRRDEGSNPINKFHFLLIQLLLVFVMFFMIFISIFLNLIKMFKKMCCISNKYISNNCCLYSFKMIFIIFFTIIILLILFPFIIIWYPFFPLILSLSDY